MREVNPFYRVCCHNSEVNVGTISSRPAQPGSQAWKTSISIRSFLDPNSGKHKDKPHNTVSASSEAELESQTNAQLAPRLCYSCHTTLTSKSRSTSSTTARGTGTVMLPMWASSKVAVTKENDEVWRAGKMSRSAMKDVVGKFLLDES